MDFKGQTAVLSAILVLVGMMFLVPAGTEKALGRIDAVAKGGCLEIGAMPPKIHPCQFTFMSKYLWNLNETRDGSARWLSEPTNSGTLVTWTTGGNGGAQEEGWVQYNVEGLGPVKLHFTNPLIGKNTCGVEVQDPKPGSIQNCNAGHGQRATFTYDLTGVVGKK